MFGDFRTLGIEVAQWPLEKAARAAECNAHTHLRGDCPYLPHIFPMVVDLVVDPRAILVHKLAILLALVGVAVHITMAAIIAEERRQRKVHRPPSVACSWAWASWWGAIVPVRPWWPWRARSSTRWFFSSAFFSAPWGGASGYDAIAAWHTSCSLS